MWQGREAAGPSAALVHSGVDCRYGQSRMHLQQLPAPRLPPCTVVCALRATWSCMSTCIPGGGRRGWADSTKGRKPFSCLEVLLAGSGVQSRPPPRCT